MDIYGKLEKSRVWNIIEGLQIANISEICYPYIIIYYENMSNKRPMGHIAHLNNTGSYGKTFRKLIYISFPFAPPDP
jgi:hypothetical protein